MTFSAILWNVHNPVMSLKSSIYFCEKTLGTGVTTSSLKTIGHAPSLSIELIKSVRGSLRYLDNLLINFGSMSPFGVDLFVLISDKRFFPL
jgi:hypothetical protein